MKTKSKKGRKAKAPTETAAAPIERRKDPLAPNQRRLVRPHELEERYNISTPTRWRWEKNGKLPKRDVYVGGVLAGWRPETLDAAERGQAAA